MNNPDKIKKEGKKDGTSKLKKQYLNQEKWNESINQKEDVQI